MEDAIEDIDEKYFKHNEGKIGLLISGENAKFTNSDYTSGSELILSVARRIGNDAIKVLFKTGTPSLIKCLVKIESLDFHCTYPMQECYSSSVLLSIIFKKLWPEELPNLEGDYMLKTPVPPQNIITF